MGKYKFYIGIDTGKNTGIAIWDAERKTFVTIHTILIHNAMNIVKVFSDVHGKQVKVRFEDARKRKWFGNAGKEQLQGAGSIKRDAVIWEDYLTDLKVDFEAVAPKNNKTKLNAKQFTTLTGVTQRTSEHARDAAMLVFGL